MDQRRIMSLLLWFVAAVVLVGQFERFGVEWKWVDYATILIAGYAGYLLFTGKDSS